MTKDPLFKSGKFVAHSGDVLDFKIDCDALSNEDIACIAKFITDRTNFGIVDGIPRGGDRIAKELEKYAKPDAPFNVLIVDDVLTTGASMEKARAIYNDPFIHHDDIIGWVIFARTAPPPWIKAVFQLNDCI